MASPAVTFKEFFGLVWAKLPEVWRSADADSGDGLLLLYYTIAQHWYYSFYQKVCAMDDLFDPELCPVKYLPFLASILNWTLQGSDPDSWRVQLQAAPLLYKLKGTFKGLLLAEKLVGYSVHTSQLYKDYVGNLLPKEKIFNSLPLSYKKPWLRTSSTITDYKDIFNSVESDLFYPLIEGLTEYNPATGDIHPRKNYIRTGSRLLATLNIKKLRTAFTKVPALNIVLKKDSPLDATTATGEYDSAYVSEAIDLLLQFKPFHIRLYNLEVLVSLDDSTYIAKASALDSAVDQEAVEIISSLPDDGNDRILYSASSITTTPPATSSEVINNCAVTLAYTRDTLSSVLSKSTPVNDAIYLSSLGFTLTGRTVINNRVYYTDDFSLVEPAAFSGLNIVADSGQSLDWMDTQTHTIPLRATKLPFALTNGEITSVGTSYKFSKSLIPASIGSTVSLPTLFLNKPINSYSGQTWIVGSSSVENSNKTEVLVNKYIISNQGSLNYGNSYSDNVAIRIEKRVTDLLTDTTTSEYTTLWQGIGYDSNRWNLAAGMANFRYPFSKAFPEIAAVYPTVEEAILNYFHTRSSIIIIYEYKDTYIPLIHGLHYILDSYQRAFIINEAALACTLYERGFYEFAEEDRSQLLSTQNTFVHVAVLTAETSALAVSQNCVTSRNSFTTSRINHILRTDLVTDTEASILRDTAVNHKAYILNDNHIVIDEANTKLYKQDIPVLLTRGFLKEQPASENTPTVTKGYTNVCDVTGWTVRLRKGSNTDGPWSRYYNVPLEDFSGGVFTAPYTSIDTTFETQLSNRSSQAWQSYLSTLQYTDYYSFLASRTSNRPSMWSRGSAKKQSQPYKSFSRSFIQPLRKDVCLFSRTSNKYDYTTDNKDLGYQNLKYSFDGVDSTISWKNFSERVSTQSMPTLDSAYATNKSQILFPASTVSAPVNELRNTSSVDIKYPSAPDSKEIFDSALLFANPDIYYANNRCKIGLYANNYNISDDPTTLLDLQSDGFGINLLSGLTRRRQQFTYTSDNLDTNQIILNATDIFWCWYLTNTGEIVGNSPEPPAGYSSTDLFLNVIVEKNGLVLPRISMDNAENWYPAISPNRIILTDSLEREPGDIFTFSYITTSNNSLSTYPFDISKLSRTIQIAPIAMYDRENMLIPLDRPPIVIWRSLDGDYINANKCLSTGNISIPEPLYNFETAFNDFLVYRDTIPLKQYVDWHFRIYDGILYVYIHPNITAMCDVGDRIRLEYSIELN